uniref:Uncharacterized protein n=1 Tax=Oryza brachyantha TaxID=4533 RepID=J3LVB6_ORYBR
MNPNSKIMKIKFAPGQTFMFGGIRLLIDQYGALSYADSDSFESKEEGEGLKLVKDGPWGEPRSYASIAMRDKLMIDVVIK